MMYLRMHDYRHKTGILEESTHFKRMSGLSSNMFNFEPSVFPGQLKNMSRVEGLLMGTFLPFRNSAVPALTGKRSRGILLSELAWDEVGRHTPKHLHNEPEL